MPDNARGLPVLPDADQNCMRSVCRTGFIELRCLYTSQNLGTSRWQLKIEGYTHYPYVRKGWEMAGYG